jgi:plasmid rolling circle replication initiator protein Rep
MHDMIWAMEKREVQWAEKVRFTHMCKFNWTHVDLLMITKMICNYRVTKEATNLKGKEVDLTIEGIVKVFKLPFSRIVTRGKEGYSTVIAKYFIGGKEDITPFVLVM